MRAIENKDDIFKALYYENYAKVLSYIHSKIRNEYQAEDLTQDVFYKCYKNLDSFDEKKAKLTTWLFVITRNTLKNYYRDKKVCLYIEDEDVNEPSEEVDFIQAIYLDEVAAYLTDELKKISETQRLVIEKKYYEELSTEEIAKELGISLVNVRVQLSRALKKLRENT